MESIKVTILGKQIPLKVQSSEIENTKRIAGFVDDKFKVFRSQFSNQPDSTIMILACLSIAEELFETKAKLSKELEMDSKILDDVNSELTKLIKQIA
ncbi:MAG: cell division protein ZapA [Balneolaceae bacterium]|nr:MAG: cell division protein ZapA [Balneolaceae bacterium]